MTPVVGKEPRNRRPQHYVTCGSSFVILNGYHLPATLLHDYYYIYDYELRILSWVFISYL